MRRRNKIKELEQEIEILRKEKADLQKLIDGEKHTTGVHCTGCVNLVEERKIGGVFEWTDRHCKLDFNCKDRVENEQ